VVCGGCSFIYVERDFPESYVNAFYEERAGGGYGLSQENFFWWHEATKHSNRHILSLLGAAKSRTMLEVGCGIGTFLADAPDARWKMSGMDINVGFPEFCLLGTLRSVQLFAHMTMAYRTRN
jgi:hypothetical protein